MRGMAHDAIVVGGGIIGCSIAWALAREKLDVLVLERQQPGSESSGAAAGMLTLTVHAPFDEQLLPLSRASLAAFPEFVAEVEAQAELKTGFRRCGGLELFFGPEGLEQQRQQHARLAAHRIPVEELTSEQVQALEPALNPQTVAALRLHDEAVVDSRRLTRAVAVAARRQGAEIRCGTLVQDICTEQGHCTGVWVDGEFLAAGQVIVAAGASSGQLAAVRRYAPTRPARGQLVVFDGSSLALQHTLRSHAGYLVAQDDGRLLAGSTIEQAGFTKAVTAAGLLQILNAVVQLVPALAQLPVVEAYSGLRPDTPDHLPILGPTDLPGLSIATGHFRNGILLAPITARLARQWVLGQPVELPLGAFSPLRFLTVPSRPARQGV